MIPRSVPLLLALILAACAPLPQRAGIPTLWQPSPSFDVRRPNYVIIHHTTNDTADEALHTLTDPRRAVSSHYLISRDGTIFQLVDERARAWHAGASYWGGTSDLNSASIGIELDNNGIEPYAEAQIAALLALLDDLRQRYAIPAANILGHGDVAPWRKSDPSHLFPWKLLAEHGFGLWCEPPYAAPAAPIDTLTALQALGYDVRDPVAALVAFRRHFAGIEAEGELTEDERALLACLVERKRY